MIGLRLFGGVSVEVGGTPLSGPVTQPRRLALLAVLACVAGRPVSRDRLVALLWPESSPARARRSLSDALYAVRRDLGDVIEASGDSVRLSSGAVACDVHEFEEAIEAGDLERAVGKYVAPFLEGFHVREADEFEEWARSERDRWKRVVAVALERLAGEAEQRGEPRRAVEWWRRLAKIEPYSAAVTVRLMGALAAAGDRGAALREASAHAALMRDEFDAEPEPEVVEMASRLRERAGTSSTPPSGAGDDPEIGREEGPGSGESSIAVLPFVNLVRDPSQEWFVDGMTEALITALSHVHALRVISRQSVMRFKGSEASMEEIGEMLGVDVMVEGSVLRAEDRVRITAQLLALRPERHLWAGTYDRGLEDVLAVHSEVTRSIVEQIEVALLPEEKRRLSARSRVDPVVHEAYLRGRHLWNRRTEEGLRGAIAQFRRALERDPSYAPAYAGLADAHVLLGAYSLVPPSEEMNEARRVAEVALELDPGLAEPHASLGAVRMFFDWDWSGAEEALRRSVEINPSHAIGHHWLGLCLAYQGRVEEAVAAVEAARRVDPLSSIIAADAGIVRGMFGREPEAALEACRRALELDPEHVEANLACALAALDSGLDEEAVRRMETVVQRTGRTSRQLGLLGFVYARTGDRAAAREVLDELERQAEARYVSPTASPTVHIGLGDLEGALPGLERARIERDPSLIYIAAGSLGDSVREDPRFTDLCRRAGFPIA